MYMSDETIYYLPKVDIAWGHNPPLLFVDTSGSAISLMSMLSHRITRISTRH
jgi:hypothetical protein